MTAKVSTPGGARLREHCAKLAESMASETDYDWWRALASRIVQRAEGVLAALADVGTLYAPDRLHALRIAIKKLRYALEFVRRAPGMDVAPALAALRRAQQRFGHLHDVQILLGQVRALAPSGADAGYDAIVESLERDCREIHARVLPHLPEIQAYARTARRDLGARRRSQRLRMAKAHASPALHRPRHAAERAAASGGRKS
jgi:CHAD domain-containing protein